MKRYRWRQSDSDGGPFSLAPRRRRRRLPRVSEGRAEGASINDIGKIFGFFDLLPPCQHLELIYTMKFTQPRLLRPLSNDPL